MHPQETRLSARRAFLEKLIDDAGLFPPASLAMRKAVEADDEARTGERSWLLGRFVLPVQRIDELLGVLPSASEPLSLSVIVDGAHVARDIATILDCAESRDGAIAVEALELRLPDSRDGDVAASVTRIVADIDASALDSSVPAYLEFSFGTEWKTHLTATFDAFADATARSAHPIAAKIRCGATANAGAPRPEQLAFAIGTLRALGVPFKATAGLHHAVRAKDPKTGTDAHGFLNVIGVAVLDYELDFDERTRHRVLIEEDPRAFALDDESFAWNDARVDAAQIAAARRDFMHSFGSCSFAEPVDDLEALGILT